MTITVCKFYAQGNCRFGSSCKFSHSDDNSNANAFNRFTDVNRFNYVNPEEKIKQKMKQKIGSAESIADMILTDFKSWVVSKVWPFSCYSVSSLDNLFPELKDLSMEEARFAYHTAQKAGTLQSHLQELAAEAQKVHCFIDAVSKTDKSKLLDMIRSKIGSDNTDIQSSTIVANNNAFATNSSNTFGGSPNIANPFATNTSSTATTAFGLKPATFGSQSSFGAAKTSFGSSSQGNWGTTATSFGQTSSSNVFGASPFSNSSTNASSNPFTNNLSSTSSPFGASSTFGTQAQNSSVFGNVNQTSNFTSNANTTSSSANPFMTAQSQPVSGFGQPSPFGTTVNQPPTAAPMIGDQTGFSANSVSFGQPSNQMAFQSQMPVGSSNTTPFGSQPSNQLASQSLGQPTNQSLFSQSQPANNQNIVPQAPLRIADPKPNPFGQATNTAVKKTAIAEDTSRIPKLTAEDLIQYKNKAFEMGKIPECPPPLELCV